MEDYAPATPLEAKMAEALRRITNTEGRVKPKFAKIQLQFPKCNEAFKTMKGAFKAIDVDNSGSIDMSEITPAAMARMRAKASAEDIRDIFSACALEANSELSFKEFIAFLCVGSLLGKFPDEGDFGSAFKIAVDAFDIFDVNSRGVIIVSDVQSALEDSQSSDALAERLRFEMDNDGNGYVTFTEFLLAFIHWVGVDDEDDDEEDDDENGNNEVGDDEDGDDEQEETEKKEGSAREGMASDYVPATPLEAKMAEAMRAITHAEGRKKPKFAKLQLQFPKAANGFMAMKGAFEKIDTDKSGTLEIAEITTALEKLGTSTASEDDIQEIYAMCDLEPNSELSFKEFVAFLCVGSLVGKLPSLMPDLEVAFKCAVDAFDVFDMSGTGVIVFTEVESALEDAVSPDALMERMQELDADGNGYVTFAEFLLAFMDWVGIDDEEDE